MYILYQYHICRCTLTEVSVKQLNFLFRYWDYHLYVVRQHYIYGLVFTMVSLYFNYIFFQKKCAYLLKWFNFCLILLLDLSKTRSQSLKLLQRLWALVHLKNQLLIVCDLLTAIRKLPVFISPSLRLITNYYV